MHFVEKHCSNNKNPCNRNISVVVKLNYISHVQHPDKNRFLLPFTIIQFSDIKTSWLFCYWWPIKLNWYCVWFYSSSFRLLWIFHGKKKSASAWAPINLNQFCRKRGCDLITQRAHVNAGLMFKSCYWNSQVSQATPQFN